LGSPLWIGVWLLQALLTDSVVIESSAFEPRLAQATIDSCNTALGDGHCRAASQAGAAAAWFVRIGWEDAEQLRARIEFRREPDAIEPDAVREIEFSQADAPEQRHKALGLIIAAYVVASMRSAPEPDRPEPSPSPPAPAPEPAASAPAPRRFATWSGDLGLTAGPGLDRGEPRFGLMLRGVVRPFDIALGGLLSLRAARRFDTTPVLWLSGSAGLALLLQTPSSPLAVETRAELVAQRMQAEARDPGSGERDEAGVWRLGGQVGLELQLRLADGFFLFGGADLGLLLPTVHIAVAGRRAGVEQALDWGGLLGLRYAR
jgi:hypothetical protein